jgi:rhodanese-related sulfurtransferase
MNTLPPLLRHVVGVWFFLTLALATGLAVNALRPTPLPLRYAPPEMRLKSTVERLGVSGAATVAIDGDVGLEEMVRVIATHGALILDARPEVFYRLGHIPGALSLPRDDFETQYEKLRTSLEAQRADAIIVYCASETCDDSALVAEALSKLGYAHVRLYRGGWSDWTSAHQPEETP